MTTTAGEEGVATYFAGRANDIGAGEILLTCMDREGTMEGLDIPTIKKVASIFKGPVIAHGGCKDVDDMEQAIKAGASAIGVGALFQFTELTPKKQPSSCTNADTRPDMNKQRQNARSHQILWQLLSSARLRQHRQRRCPQKHVSFVLAHPYREGSMAKDPARIIHGWDDLHHPPERDWH
jgi:tRNA-dihydrouridine synthase